MEDELEDLLRRRQRRQLVYPFIELEHQDDIFEVWRDKTTMVEIVEISKDGRLLSITEDTETDEH